MTSSRRTSSGERVLVFVPAYNCASQIPRVLAQLTPAACELVDEVVVVDNRSTDDTLAVAERALRALSGPRARLLRNVDNYGLGGSHKVAIQLALAEGVDHLVVLHGDDQADLADFLPALRAGMHREHDALLGSRFAPGSRLHGYSPVRTAGNHVFNALFSAVARRRLTDLGSGLNLFRVELFEDGFFLRLADDLTFNYHLVLHAAARRWDLRFVPISWREEDQVSNVKLVSQSRRMLTILRDYLTARDAFLARDHSPGGRSYVADTIYDSAARD